LPHAEVFNTPADCLWFPRRRQRSIIQIINTTTIRVLIRRERVRVRARIRVRVRVRVRPSVA